MEKQTEKDRKIFASALSHSLDDLGYPAAESGRAWQFHKEIVKPLFGHSYETARKWIMGEGVPHASKFNRLAGKLNCTVDFLMTNMPIETAVDKPLLNEYVVQVIESDRSSNKKTPVDEIVHAMWSIYYSKRMAKKEDVAAAALNLARSGHC